MPSSRSKSAFFLPEKSEKQLEKEAEYFTLKENYKVANYTDIVGSTIKPFMEVKNQYANFAFEKIAPKDSVSIIFEEQYIDLKIGENERRFEIKTVDSKDYAGEDEDPQITRILETSWKTDKKFKIRFYLNSKNLVQKLELGPTLYYLMMTQ